MASSEDQAGDIGGGSRGALKCQVEGCREPLPKNKGFYKASSRAWTARKTRGSALVVCGGMLVAWEAWGLGAHTVHDLASLQTFSA
jgi:hypothetical protein